MQRKEAEEIYLKKIKQLKKYNKTYFDDDNPTLFQTKITITLNQKF